jgi:hypothetical protein
MLAPYPILRFRELVARTRLLAHPENRYGCISEKEPNVLHDLHRHSRWPKNRLHVP